MQHSDLIKQITLVELTFKKIDSDIPLEVSESHLIMLNWTKKMDQVTLIDPLRFEGPGTIKTKFCCHSWSRRIHLTTDFETALASLQSYFNASVKSDDRSSPR